MPVFRCSVCEAFNRLADAAPRRCAACEAKLDLSGRPQEVNAEALARAIARSPVPLFVDFWAPWCGPCLMAAPVVKALGCRMAGEIVVLSVDVQDAPEAGAAHAIHSIPTFAIFRHREEVARRTGVLPRGETERWTRSITGLAQAAARA